MRIRSSSCAPVVASMLLLAGRDAQAVEYYVDGACGQPGDGLVDGCAAEAGGPGAFIRELAKVPKS